MRVTIKDYRIESHLFMQRAVQALVFAVLLVAILVGRLVYLQVIRHEDLVHSLKPVMLSVAKFLGIEATRYYVLL